MPVDFAMTVAQAHTLALVATAISAVALAVALYAVARKKDD